MNNTTPCIFCGKSSPEVKITKEHVLRKWLKQHLSIPDTHICWQQNYLDKFKENIYWEKIIPIEPYEMTVREVCKTCNEGWLNLEIEIPVQKTLVSLAKLENIYIDINETQKLAIWAAKTAAIRALIDSGERAIPKEHYYYIKEKKLPPPQTSIWISSCNEVLNTWTRHKRSLYECNGQEIRTHETTITIGCLVVHIFGMSHFDDKISFDFYDSLIESFFPNETIKIWPQINEFLWPLKQIMNKAELENFSDFITKNLIIHG